MKLNSKYFDSIRSRSKPAPEPRESQPRCQWKGCANSAGHRAPVGRGHEGKYYFFCLDHVREYNSTYNYFTGMSDAEIQHFQKDAITGHRPTWKMGGTAWQPGVDGTASRAEKAARFRRFRQRFEGKDPHETMGENVEQPAEPARRRGLKTLERKALDDLGLDASADGPRIKSRFKELVKLHHPDLNGGDKRSEDKLREVIQAYNYLKQAGLV